MTADAFIAALRRSAADYRAEQRDSASRPAADEKLRRWDAIAERETLRLNTSRDPILDLLARYDLAGITFWQFKFVPTPQQTFDQMWGIADRTTREYLVDGGQVYEMDWKAANPTEIGMTSAQFLDVIAIYAELTLRFPVGERSDRTREMLFVYAERARKAHPRSDQLGWFPEPHE